MMEKDKNKIDEMFKAGLGDPEFEFNESHWDNLEFQLNKDSRLKKRKAVFYAIAATAAAIRSGFLAGISIGMVSSSRFVECAW